MSVSPLVKISPLQFSLAQGRADGPFDIGHHFQTLRRVGLMGRNQHLKRVALPADDAQQDMPVSAANDRLLMLALPNLLKRMQHAAQNCTEIATDLRDIQIIYRHLSDRL